MTHKELIGELVHRLNWDEAKVSGVLDATVNVLNEKLLENTQLFVSDFGTFGTEKRVEHISVNSQTGERYLIPPQIVVVFESIEQQEEQHKGKGMSIDELFHQIAAQSDLSIEEVSLFSNTLFASVTDKVSENNPVEIHNLGTFRLTRVEARESIDEGTDEKTQSPAQNKIAFIPSDTLKEMVNKPFAHFEAVLLNEGFEAEGVAVLEDDERDVETFDETVENLAEEIVIEVEETPKPMDEEKESDSPPTIGIRDYIMLPQIRVRQARSVPKKMSGSLWGVFALAGALILSSFLMKKRKKVDD